MALALDARMEAVSPRGTRSIAAGDFFDGVWSTSLLPDEVLAGVSFPVWSGRCGFAVEEFARRHGDFAIAGTALGLELDDDDRIRRCAIGLIGLGSTPERAVGAEAAVVGASVTDVDPDEVGRLAVEHLESVPYDLHGSADYRRQVGGVMVARAWVAASEEAAVGDAVVHLTVNGQVYTRTVESRLTLADFLREQCRLTGTHLGCEHGVCGGCTVLVDGEAVRRAYSSRYRSRGPR